MLFHPLIPLLKTGPRNSAVIHVDKWHVMPVDGSQRLISCFSPSKVCLIYDIYGRGRHVSAFSCHHVSDWRIFRSKISQGVFRVIGCVPGLLFSLPSPPFFFPSLGTFLRKGFLLLCWRLILWLLSCKVLLPDVSFGYSILYAQRKNQLEELSCPSLCCNVESNLMF